MTKLQGRFSRLDWSRLSGVYAVCLPGCLAVKVGWSRNIRKRLLSMVCAMPFEPVLVGYREAECQSEEYRIHRILREYRLRGEWFVWCEPVKRIVSVEFVTAFPVDDDPRLAFSFSGAEEGAGFCDSVLAAFDALGPKGRDMLCRSANLDGPPATLEDLCQMFSWTPRNARQQRRRKYLKKLARHLRRSGEGLFADCIDQAAEPPPTRPRQ